MFGNRSEAANAPKTPSGARRVRRSLRPQRIVVMGTGPFAVPTFSALTSAGHEISLVVTRPQPPTKSRKAAPVSPVREWAESLRLPIFDPADINDPAAVQRLITERAALLVVCDYGQILKPPALESTPLGGINLHGSLLPAYRGAAPVQWAILSGDAVTGVSVIHMTPRLDGGPIIAARQTPIGERETAGELEERLAELGVEATLEAVERLAAWDGKAVIGTPQDATRVCRAPRLQKSDGAIDWSRSTEQIDCQVRALQPWPVAYTHAIVGEGKPPLRIAIKAVHRTGTPRPEQAAAGEILPGEELDVATGNGVLRVERLQPAGKREMTGKEFRRGYQHLAGTQLVSADT